MLDVIRVLLKTQLKRGGLVQRGGFTLIELLVALLLAFLVIAPLLGFMLNILDTDRKEQAKTNSEQEIQTALDYIARDLQQAVYVYDADGLTRGNSSTPSSSGIKDQIPPIIDAPGCSDDTACKPVLVFWKRQFIKEGVGVSSVGDTQRNDAFVYALVGYYLIEKDNDSVWSKNAARIGRFQIQGSVVSDGLVHQNGSYTAFKPFDLSKDGSTVKDKMNQWQALTSTYNQNVITLADYVDQSDNVPSPNCPNSSKQQVPTTLTGGFYACVDAEKADQISAQVYLQGNALARVQNNEVNSNDRISAYFPNASVKVKGRGYVYTK